MSAATSSPAWPYVTAHFVLSIDALTSVSFTKCTGLSAEVSVEEYVEGGENRFTHQLPGRVTSPRLVLSQGAGAARELWDWFDEYRLTGMVRPRNGTISLLGSVDGAPAPVRVWSFTRGWPAKLTGPDLDAASAAVAIDSLEIAHHGLELRKGV